MNRRRFIKCAAAVPMFLSVSGCKAKSSDPMAYRSSGWFMPDEGEQHECTWMAFGASEKFWGKKLIDEVRRNLATVAQTIARYEPVVMLVRDRELELARSFFSSEVNIEWLVCPLDDLWLRDTGPVFLVNEHGDKAAADLNFNGWGEKQDYDRDAEVAARVAEHAEVELIETDLVLEGGAIEVDGEGTAIITESCVLNANRNPDVTREACEQELMELLGLEKIIWLPGVKDEDITDGHTDFYARFAGPGVVVAGLETNPKSFDYKVTRRHLEILQDATDAQGRRLRVVSIEGPTTVRKRFESDEFCAGYINFYVCNQAVIATEFGDWRADGSAREKLAELFPNRDIVMLNIDGIAAGGGGIHCATQQEPKSQV